MGFQKCPVCGGIGYEPNLSGTSTANLPCSVCGGMKIISELTGKPPKHDGKMCPHDINKVKFC